MIRKMMIEVIVFSFIVSIFFLGYNLTARMPLVSVIIVGIAGFLLKKILEYLIK